MAKSETAKSATPYARRLLEDEYVQEQLGHAAAGLRDAYQRTRKKRGKAAEDKHLYNHLRHAATSIRNAATALQRPQPKPKRRLGKVAILVFAIGGCAGLVIWLQKHQSTLSHPSEPATGVEASGAGVTGSQPTPQPEQAATGSSPQP